MNIYHIYSKQSLVTVVALVLLPHCLFLDENMGGYEKMKEKKIKVLKVEPGMNPVAVELTNKLEALQEAVSIGADYTGLIEIIELNEKICLLCNEEGKLIGLPGNRRVGSDIIPGTFYITGQDEDGNLTSLTAEQMWFYQILFWEPETYTQSEVEDSIQVTFIPI